MTNPLIPTRMLPLLLSSILSGAISTSAHAETAPLEQPKQNAAPLLAQMVGTWDVQSRTWPAAGSEPIALEPAIAIRTLVSNAYLQEIMESISKSDKSAFTRTSYINYNAVSGLYEYFSVDTRAPQQMNYQSSKREIDDTSQVKFNGGEFVAAKWGDAINVAFNYRLTLENVTNNSQTVHLYLTPSSGNNKKEFRAFEYIYTKRN